MKRHKYRQETEAVRGGIDLSKKNGPLSTPIYQTSTFEVTDSQQQVRATSTDRFYSRYGNPTNSVVEAAMAELGRGPNERCYLIPGCRPSPLRFSRW